MFNEYSYLIIRTNISRSNVDSSIVVLNINDVYECVYVQAYIMRVYFISARGRAHIFYMIANDRSLTFLLSSGRMRIAEEDYIAQNWEE